MPTQLIFRTDANSQIGLGHLTRCLALADMLVPDFASAFFIREPSVAIQEQVQQAGFRVVEVPPALSLLEEPAWLQANVEPLSILVLDGYHFTPAYQRIVKEQRQALVYLDDLLMGYSWADMLINQAGGIVAQAYHSAAGTTFCLGARYALLRQPFSQAAQLPLASPDTNRVFLNMGGADPDNHTLQLLQYLRQHLPQHHIEVVTGSAYPHLALLRQVAHSWPEVQFHHNLSAEQMVEVLQRCGIKVCPPSGVAYECCAVGGLILLHRIADNQQRLFSYLTEQGLAAPLSALPSFSVEELTVLAAAMQEQQRTVFDGNSAHRFRKAFQELALAHTLTCRRATDQDCRQYFEWANDNAVRSNAIHSDPIRWEDHQQWFGHKASSSTSALYFFELQGLPVGQVRFDFTEREALIDYSVASTQRGRGLGIAILQRALLELQHDHPGPWTLIAQVKEGNLPSRRVFERLGFAAQLPVVLQGHSYDEFRFAFVPPA